MAINAELQSRRNSTRQKVKQQNPTPVIEETSDSGRDRTQLVRATRDLGGNPSPAFVSNSSIPTLERNVVNTYEQNAPKPTLSRIAGAMMGAVLQKPNAQTMQAARTNNNNYAAAQRNNQLYNDLKTEDVDRILNNLGQTDIARKPNEQFVESIKSNGGSTNPFDYKNFWDFQANSPLGGAALLDVLSAESHKFERQNLTPEMVRAGLTEKDLEIWNNARNEEERQQVLSQWAAEHPIVSTARSFPENIGGSLENVANILGSYATGTPMESKPSRAEIYRNAVSEGIDSGVGRFAYNAGTSAGDMILASLIAGPAGAAAPAIGAGTMGIEKASATANDAIDRGLNPNQIVGEMVGSGLTTALTELIPFNNIFKGASILKGMATEGGQEIAEDLADTLLDELVTGLGRNHDKSSLSTSYHQYLDAGYTPYDAVVATAKDYGKQLIMDGALGAVTGGAIQGGANLVSGRNVITGKLPELNAETETQTETKIEPEVKANPAVAELEELSKDVIENPSVEKYEAFVETLDKVAEANPEISDEIGKIYADVNNFYEENADTITAVNNNIDNVNENVGIPVYRGYNRSLNPLDSNLARTKTLTDFLPKLGETAPGAIPLSYYTEDQNVAKGYARQNLDFYNEVGPEAYRILTGDESIPVEGETKAYSINPNNVFDITGLGEKIDSEQLYRYLSETLGPEFEKAFPSLDYFDPNVNTENEGSMFAYQLLRNNGDANYGDTGTRFYNLLKNLGYDAVRYAEQGTNQYAIFPEVQALENTQAVEPEARASRREINEAIRAAEGIKSKLAMVNERNARVLEKRVEKAIEKVRTTSGQAQIQAIADLNTLLNGVNNVMQYSQAGIRKREVNKDNFENMRNVTNGRKIKVTPEMLNNINVRTVTDLNNLTNTGTNNRIRFYSENTKNDAAVSLDSIWDEMVEQSGNELPRVMEGDQLQALIDYINAYKSGKNEEVNTVAWNDLESDFRSEGERQIDEIADNLFDKIEDGTATRADWEQAFDAIDAIQKADKSLAERAYQTMTELSNASREQTSNANVDSDINSAETWDDVESLIDDLFDDSEEIIGEVPHESNQSSGVHNRRFKQSRFFTNTGDRILSEQQIKQHETANDMLYEENSEKESVAEAYKRLEEKGVDEETRRLMHKDGFTNVDVDELMILWKQATENANDLDANGLNSDEAWGYCAKLFEKVKEETSRNAQALQAVAKWSRNNTPQGLLTQAAAIIGDYENGYKKGKVDWHRDVRRNTKKAKTLDADFMKNFLKEADNLYTGTWEDVKKLTDGYTIHITPEMLKALGFKKLSQLNAAVYTDTGNSIKFTTTAKDPKTQKPYKGIEQAYREIYEKASDRFLDPDTISETKMLQTLYQFITQKGRMVNLETRAARHTMANLGRMVNEQMPSNIAEKVTTFLMDNMLGNFRTLITRNAGGNIGFNLVEEFLRKPLSAAIDTQLAKKSGTRTVSGLTKEGLQAWKQGFIDGVKQEIYDFKNDIQSARSGENTLDTAVANNRNNIFDIQKLKKVKDSNGLENGRVETTRRSKLFKLYNKLVKTGLSVGDRPFYEATYKQSMAEYKKLFDEGKMGDLTKEEFQEIAELHARLNALAAVYQDDTVMAKAFVGFKNDIGDISRGLIGADVLSQFSMPFVKTPANIIERSIEYSPLGYVKNLVQTVRDLKTEGLTRENQERISTELSRNLIGTALFAIGVGMAQAGRLTGGYDEDKDMRQAQKEAGMQEYALHTGIGDFDISWLPVLGNNLVAAANAYDKYNNSEESGLQALSSGATAGVASQFNTSALQGLQRLVGGAGTGYARNTENSGFVGNMKNTALAGLTQFVPSLLRQAAAFGDENQRQLSGTNPDDYYYNSVRNALPFLRESLQPKIGRTGEALEQNPGQGQFGKFLSNFISPATWTVGTPDAVRDEAMRLYESTGNTVAFQTTVELKDLRKDGHEPTPEEFTQYQQAAYGAMNQIASDFIQSDYYQSLNDGEREQMLSDIYSAIRSVEKLNIIDGDKSNLDGAAKAYDDGGEEGLINYLIAKNTLAALGRQNNPANREEILETLNQGGLNTVQGMVDHSQELSNEGLDTYNLQQKYDHALQTIPSLTPTQFMETWDQIDGMIKPNDSISQDEMLAYLNQSPESYNINQVLEYWNAYGDDWTYQPYWDEKNGVWKKHKP